MILKGLLARKQSPSAKLYAAIVAAARRPHFYADWDVPDTVDGRFDMIALHLFAVLDRIKVHHKDAAQALVDTFFDDMDRSLREMGVGDLSVGKKVRKIAESFYGRVDAYTQALAGQDGDLAAAIARNVFAGIEPTHAGRLADWLHETRSSLAGQDSSDIAAGEVSFP